MSKVLDALIHFGLLSTALIVFLNNFNHLNRCARMAGYYLLVTFFFDAVAAAIMFNKGLAKLFGNNLFLYHILTPIQYVLIARIYVHVITTPVLKRIILISIPVFILLSVLFSSTIQTINNYNSYSQLLKYLLTILWILFFLKQTLVLTHYPALMREPIFWISTAFLFYSTGNIIVEGMANYLINRYGNYFERIYYIYSILNYLLFCLFIVAFAIKRK